MILAEPVPTKKKSTQNCVNINRKTRTESTTHFSTAMIRNNFYIIGTI